MEIWLFLAMCVVAGAGVGLQSPINATLAKTTGGLESALVSFTVGWVVLFAAVLALGSGSFRAVLTVPSWQMAGGLFGALFVATIVFAVPKVGVAPMLVATIAGQMAVSIAIDQFGWFGLPQRPIDLSRAAGVALLFVSLALITKR